jgi:hypothetical protein
MMRLLSIAVLGSAATLAAIPISPASAASVTVNNVGTSARVSTIPNTLSGRRFAPSSPVINAQGPRHKPRQGRWVCGPIVNWDGSPHCHWVP